MIKIGILGMTEGNAHPYSWSAIINGQFDGDAITKLGYPALAAYLQANKGTLGLNAARVTHVWTQDDALSQSIATSAGIAHVAGRYEDMIGQVDAIMLLRSDIENHVKMAAPFLDAGIPIFIEKPLAGSLEDLDYFAAQVAKGRLIMSCSSMRYSSEAITAKIEMAAIGKPELIIATGKKDWLNYGVHMLECIMMLLDEARPVSVRHIGESGKDIVHITFPDGLQVMVNMFMDISGTFQVSIYGQKDWRLVDIKNSYTMFRDNIIEFIRSVQDGKARLDFSKTDNIIRALLAARQSLAQGGETIYL